MRPWLPTPAARAATDDTNRQAQATAAMRTIRWRDRRRCSCTATTWRSGAATPARSALLARRSRSGHLALVGTSGRNPPEPPTRAGYRTCVLRLHDTAQGKVVDFV